MKRGWLDTESNDFGGKLISLAIVSESGQEFYEAIPCEHPTPWVIDNVIPKINKHPISINKLQMKLRDFLQNTKIDHIIADWPHDFVLFGKILIVAGNYIGPEKLIMEIRHDLIYPISKEDEHNALNDARALKRLHIQSEAVK